jgi:hypothetical protein
MEKQEIEKLVQLRQRVIEFYKGLEGHSNPGTSLMKQQDTAHMLETVIKSMDHILQEYVKFD